MPIFLVRLSLTVPVVAQSNSEATSHALEQRARIESDRELSDASVVRSVARLAELAPEWHDNPPYGQMAGVELTCRQILEAEARNPPARYCILLTGQTKKGKLVVEVLGRDNEPKEEMRDARLFDSVEEAGVYAHNISIAGKVLTVAPLDGPWTVPLPGTIPTSPAHVSGG